MKINEIRENLDNSQKSGKTITKFGNSRKFWKIYGKLKMCLKQAVYSLEVRKFVNNCEELVELVAKSRMLAEKIESY